MSRQTFGIIVSTRSFFPSHLVKEAREGISTLLDKLGHAYVMVGEEDTHLGAVINLDEAKKCAALFTEHKSSISGIIVVLPNFGDELGVAEAIDRADLAVPVLVQACSDDFDQLGMEQRRDAFCGKISLCNNLRQRGIPFSLTQSHACALDSPGFVADVERFAAICRVVRGLKNNRIAMLGSRPLAFGSVRFSEKILQRHGISVQTVDLSEVLATAAALDDTVAIAARAEEICTYGRICEGVGKEKITLQARLSIAMEQWVDDLDCQASTVQCWDSLQHNYGCAACLSMSMMGEKGRPSACESDVTGAFSMLAAQLAADSTPALMDWNNNVNDEADRCIALHCANFPKSFFGGTEIEIASLDVLGSTLGSERTFGAVKGQVAPGAMTFVRISTDDTLGVMKMYVGEGEFESGSVDTKGGVALCRVAGLQQLLRHICQEGFEHHVCFVRGHVADVLAEAMGRYMGVAVHRHGA